MTIRAFVWAVLGVIASGLAAPARADLLSLGGNYVTIYGTLTQGSNTYGPALGAGNVSPSTIQIGGPPAYFSWIYCVDIIQDIGVPATYTLNSNFSANIHGNIVNNAGQVAWLLDHYAGSATTPDLQGGLQASIWSTIYNGTGTGMYSGNYVFDTSLTGPNTPGTIAAYNTDLSALGTNTGNIGEFLWLNPGGNDSGLQGLVGEYQGGGHPDTGLSSAPEPSSLVLGLSGAVLGCLGWLRRRRIVLTP
jgi:hypothetical protein